ncbi:Stress-related protein [Vitis vinifera]|uniref:Stress-related protein n=1 Tax=Vitis vinifera TaxID=29760 RepID=A0A438FK92_VITVI|nr:Stress-related protein [Vitis vinifera]
MAVADSMPQQEMAKEEEQRLKYLEFVQVATLHAVLCFSSLYEYAKERSGPLKPGVQTVEGTVKTVVAPVYDKFHGVPIELLRFIDRKVDESVSKFGKQVPPVVKQVSSQAVAAAQKAPSVARAVTSEVQRSAKDLYTKYEPVAQHYAVSAWHSLNRLPLFPQVVQVVVPTAAYCSERYNQTVLSTAEKGYKVSTYLPLVPTEKITKVFGAEVQSH